MVSATGAVQAAPSWAYPLGTDEAGRSVLALAVWGSRVSLTVGFLTTTLVVVVGTAVGVAAACLPRFPAAALNLVTQWFLVLPALPLAVALAAVLRSGTAVTVVAIAGVMWAGVARLVRAQTLAIQAQPYLERSAALGAGRWHRLRTHVLPALVPLLIASATLVMSDAILAEATLSFLGLGDPSAISWGSMLRRAVDAGAVTTAWWCLVVPGAAISTVVLAFAACGRMLESALDPRSGRS